MIFNVDVGLYAGLGFSLILVIIKSQRYFKINKIKFKPFFKYTIRARSTILGNIPGTNVYECIDVCNDAKELEAIRIIRYEESLYYANVDNFRYKVLKLSKINPDLIKQKIIKESKKEIKSFIKMYKQKKNKKEAISHLDASDFSDTELGHNIKGDLEENKSRILEEVKKRNHDAIKNKHIVLDCSCMNFIDSQGVDAILKVIILIKLKNIKRTKININKAS